VQSSAPTVRLLRNRFILNYLITTQYQKVITDRYGMVTIYQEASFIPLNLRPNYTLNVKLK